MRPVNEMGLSYDVDREAFFEKCQQSQSVPGNDALKLVLLERILEEFEAGVVYSKSEVDERIRRHFDQHILLRRELVNFGYLRYDNRANEYRVERLELTEADVRETDRLRRHAEDVGALD